MHRFFYLAIESDLRRQISQRRGLHFHRGGPSFFFFQIKVHRLPVFLSIQIFTPKSSVGLEQTFCQNLPFKSMALCWRECSHCIQLSASLHTPLIPCKTPGFWNLSLSFFFLILCQLLTDCQRINQ